MNILKYQFHYLIVTLYFVFNVSQERQQSCKHEDKELYLTNVTEITSDIFDHCPYLENVNIDGKNLSQIIIHPQSFWPSTKIMSLSITNAHLQKIEGIMFQNIADLKFLDLSNNQFKEFPLEEFPVLMQVEVLNLTNNYLGNLNAEDIFSTFPSLKTLHFYNNSIPCERERIIKDKLARRGIDSSDEYFDALDACAPPPSDRRIIENINCDSSHTRLDLMDVDEIKVNAFVKCSNLKEIHIDGTSSDNPGLTLDVRTFWSNLKLQLIDITNVRLHKIHGEMFTNLTNLKSLNFSNNQLIDFPIYTFSKLPRMEVINLTNNFLTDLAIDDVLDKFPSLKVLHFYNNSIECDQEKEIKSKLENRNIEYNDAYFDTLNIECVSSSKIDEILKKANLSMIRGRLDNEPIRGEVKQLRETNKELQESFLKIEEEVTAVLQNISEIQNQVTLVSKQILSVPSLEETVAKVKSDTKPTNFVTVAIIGLSLALSIVVGVVIKCFMTMNGELQTLRKQEAMKSYQSKRITVKDY